MSVPDSIRQLVELFKTHRAAYRSQEYHETQVRREFIDPFFEALGWDVFNKKGYAPAYKDVIHEDAIKVGGANKAPDYAFRIGGTRKFFVEAKKPAVNLRDEISPAYQLRRYAWSAKLPLSILTDFEEFAVYDCRVKPAFGDKPSTGRIMLLSYQDYLTRWEEIESVFSRQAVLKGSFDKYAESTRGKRGTAEVDDAFLMEIERWRELLARNIALRNPALSQRELNYAVQMTIDRLIFLRICEDRGIEFYGQLQALLNGGEVYPRLTQLFRKADERYNSGLFHFRDEKEQADAPDRLTLGLALDDKPLKDILGSLYYPESPYEFSVLPADILGQVYERFLGKVIRLTSGHRAVVEEKPEVKKAGGVFYTPTYIVEYIVRQTVGALLESKKPGERGVGGKGTPLRILDPACGSGSFLLGAYQTLLDWYRDGYLAAGAEKYAAGRSPALVQVAGGEWRLTMAERKRILLDHIYGVDIDPQAVEVTKLSLLLKVLEGESQESIGKQLSLFRERALPDLGQNIKCGNSLIGSDFYAGGQASFLETDEQYRINAFDWEREFREVFAGAGGFDAVIGNPPYVRQEGLGKDKEYYQAKYESYVPTADLYVNFIEKALHLLNPTGIAGMIVSNKWLRAAYGRPLRKLLTEKTSISQVIDLAGLPVFENATVRTIIIIYTPVIKEMTSFRYLAPPKQDEFRAIHSGDALRNLVTQKSQELSLDSLSLDGWRFVGVDTQKLLQRLQNNTLPLTTYIKGKLYRGIITGFNEAYIVDEQTRDQLIKKDEKSAEIIKPIVGGRDVRRYHIDFNDKYLLWTYMGVPISRYPAIFEHLKQYKSQLQKRWDQGNFWWELRACDYYEKFQNAKIIYPDIATSCRFYLDLDGYFGSNTNYFIPSGDKYLLGILNSRLAQFYFIQVCAGLEGGNTVYLRFFGQYMEDFPVRPISFSNPGDVKRHDSIVVLVDRILNLHRQLAAAQTPAEKSVLQRQIEATDAEIDRLVYALYGLSEEEIKIVEGK
jgi:hypothetical protein